MGDLTDHMNAKMDADHYPGPGGDAPRGSLRSPEEDLATAFAASRCALFKDERSAPTKSERAHAARVVRSLRDAGWRILR